MRLARLPQRGVGDRQVAHDAEEGAVEHDAGKNGRNRRRRLAVGVGEPGVHGRKPGLGPESDHDENEGEQHEPGIDQLRVRGSAG